MRYDMCMAPDIDPKSLYYILGLDEEAKRAVDAATAEKVVMHTVNRAVDDFGHTFGHTEGEAMARSVLREELMPATSAAESPRLVIFKSRSCGATTGVTVIQAEEWLRETYSGGAADEPARRQPKTKHGRAATPGRDRNRATKARLMRGKA